MERIDIQIQDETGNWRTYNSIMQNNSALIIMSMKQLKDQFPDRRVRAIDQNGRVVDILV